MRTKIVALALVVLAVLPHALARGNVVVVAHGPVTVCLKKLLRASDHDHASSKHAKAICRMKRISEIEVSKGAGLGQVEIHENLAAVVQRDEGAVALIDIENPREPKVLGRYDDDIPDSFDGDVAFSNNGKWLFYARQTHEFSRDGIHVLDISNPKQPRLAFYQPQGGTFRIGYLRHNGEEYIATMDAITGLVINRFEPTTGALIPVFADALPALKVGGPASAGVFIDKKDPALGVPILYTANGTSGLDIYDLSDPTAPEKLASWTHAGLADIEVRTTKRSRLVYAASEYWFNEREPASVYTLDAFDLDRIRQEGRFTAPLEPNENWRVNGLESSGERLYVALSHAGLASLDLRGTLRGLYHRPRPANQSSSLKSSPYAMDVESAGGLIYLTDAATGNLTILRAR